MVAADDMTGHDGFFAKALPHDVLMKVMKTGLDHGR
jgi:hypothetical protein